MDPITIGLGAVAASTAAGALGYRSKAKSHKEDKESAEERESFAISAKHKAIQERDEAEYRLDAATMNDSTFRSLDRIPFDWMMSTGVFSVNEPKKAFKAVDGGIAKLVLPAGTRVVSPRMGDKLRVDQAYVYEIQRVEDESKEKLYENNYVLKDETVETAPSFHMRDDFEYEEGMFVEPENGLDTNTSTTCSAGIHLFRDRHGAKRYHGVR